MGEMKIKLSDSIERAFREQAMQEFGYTKGSLSHAAEQAIDQWVRSKPKKIKTIRTIKGMLKHVRKNSVELQHEIGRIRGEKHSDRRKHLS